MTFSKITKELITGYCQWLEDERQSSIKTRNLRLTAIHSFFKYVQTQMPEHAALCRNILNISMKKCDKKPPVHLSDLEIKMLLAEPNIHTREGIRDLAVMTMLYDTGARVSELIELRVCDLNMNQTTTVKIVGKGKKMRYIPVSPETSTVLKAYFKSNKIDTSQREKYVFVNKNGTRLTRPGINYILNKYVNLARENNPGYFTVTVTAHVLRHSKACHLLLSDINLIYIRDFLGHSSVVTTEHYAKTNPEFLRRAIERNAENNISGLEKYSDEAKETLMEFLKTYRN